MSDKYTKPKNITQVGETFEDILKRKGKNSLERRSQENIQPYTNNSLPSNYNYSKKNNRSKSLSENAKAELNKYREDDKHILILQVWNMLMQAFDSKLSYFFGDEPDARLMKFAASLTPAAYKRLEANLLERLDEDKEWPPSLIRLQQLANSPTKESTYNASMKLFHHPVPKKELDRVELYIKNYKMHEVRKLPERNFDSEFRRKYTLWFREVMLDDMDIKLEEKRNEINSYLENTEIKETDKLVNEKISNGDAFKNKFGSRILKAMKEKTENSVEEITEEEKISFDIKNRRV